MLFSSRNKSKETRQTNKETKPRNQRNAKKIEQGNHKKGTEKKTKRKK